MNSVEEVQYWMITGDWLQFLAPPPGSSIATIENPNPQAQEPVVVPMRKTEFINMHPAKYCILMQQERPRFTLLLALQINRRTFDWVQELAAAAANAANNGGTTEASVAESEEETPPS